MPDAIDQLDAKLAKLDRLYRMQLGIILLTASAVLWGGRLEWSKADHEARIHAVETDTRGLREDMIEVKTRIHGVATQVGRVPGKVAAKLNE